MQIFRLNETFTMVGYSLLSNKFVEIWLSGYAKKHVFVHSKKLVGPDTYANKLFTLDRVMGGGGGCTVRSAGSYPVIFSFNKCSYWL